MICQAATADRVWSDQLKWPGKCCVWTKKSVAMRWPWKALIFLSVLMMANENLLLPRYAQTFPWPAFLLTQTFKVSIDLTTGNKCRWWWWWQVVRKGSSSITLPISAKQLSLEAASELLNLISKIASLLNVVVIWMRMAAWSDGQGQERGVRLKREGWMNFPSLIFPPPPPPPNCFPLSISRWARCWYFHFFFLLWALLNSLLPRQQQQQQSIYSSLAHALAVSNLLLLLLLFIFVAIAWESRLSLSIWALEHSLAERGENGVRSGQVWSAAVVRPPHQKREKADTGWDDYGLHRHTLTHTGWWWQCDVHQISSQIGW